MKKYKDAKYLLFFNYTMIRRRTRHLHISISCWIGSCKVSISSVEVEKAVIALVIHRSKGKMSVNWNPVSPTCIHHSSLFVVIVYNEHTFFSKCYMWRNFTRICDSNLAFGKENCLQMRQMGRQVYCWSTA